MSKGLEALAELYSYIKPGFDYQTAKAVEDYKIIEKELKALEIIKKKQVNIFLFKECYKNKWKMPYSYNQSQNKRRQLNEEEYVLLKEALL